MLIILFDGTETEAKALADIRTGLPFADISRKHKLKIPKLNALYRRWLETCYATLIGADDPVPVPSLFRPILSQWDSWQTQVERLHARSTTGDLKAAALVSRLIAQQIAVQDRLLAARPAEGDTQKAEGTRQILLEEVAGAQRRLRQAQEQGHDSPTIRAALQANDEILAGAL